MRRSSLLMASVLVAVLMLLAVGAAAQETPAPPPAFALATNTPSGEAAPAANPFATNTPSPTMVPIRLPEATIDRYALRRWEPTTLLAALIAQVRALQPGDTDGARAVQLLQYELATRFPAEPRDLAARTQLISALLEAPPGMVDMRAALTPFIALAFEQQRPPLDAQNSFDFSGFNFTITPAALNGDPVRDAIVQVRYPAGMASLDQLRFQQFVLVTRDEAGAYSLLAGDYPAAPFGPLTALTLERAADLNADRLDEMALSLTYGDALNREMVIIGQRGGAAVNLIEPGARVSYNALVDWPFGGTSFTVRELRIESEVWDCQGGRDIPWAWTANFFRPGAAPAFAPLNGLACQLYQAEPIFERPVDSAISQIESALPAAGPDDAIAVQRAQLTLAMLHVVRGDRGMALDIVGRLSRQADLDADLGAQVGVLLNRLGNSGDNAITLCAAVSEVSQHPACDLDPLLAQLFAANPLLREEPIEPQLNRLGLTVLDSTTISQVGLLDRLAFRLDLPGEHWWAFVPFNQQLYSAEAMETPADRVPTAAPTAPDPQVPERAYAALLVSGDARTVLNILDNLERSAPDQAPSAEARFLRAFAYDLLGDRALARTAYYALWSELPATVWGQLAAAHLELR
jgi:hypothetical protein